jgi:hypothetical protein
MLLRTSLVLSALLATGCAPTARSDAPRSAAEGATAASAGTPLGKRAAPRPGEAISPVIAFRGAGADWRLQIENTGGLAHSVDLRWDGDRERANGSLRYEGTAAVDAPIVLVGALQTASGARAMRVDITAGLCRDAAGAGTHAVRITVAGLAPMRGCGDLAK